MKKILIFCIVTLFIIQNTFATEEVNDNGISIKVENIFSSFIDRSEKKNGVNKTLTSVNKLEGNIISYFERQNIVGDKYIILDSLMKLSREYLSEQEYYNYNIKRNIILNKHSITKDFSHKILAKSDVFLEDGIRYTYIFTSHLAFPEGVVPTQRDLDYNNISIKENIVFITEDNLVGYVKDYTKVKLISDDIIYGIPNKFDFLNEIRDDKKSIQNDTDKDFMKIKTEALTVTKGLYKQDDKIAALYNHVLENVSYTQPISLEDKKIFSGIETYKNNDGVCEGYVKYFQYLLQFNGIKDVKSIRGYVIDAQDYPQIGHAWTKIGDNYYDPTFDDPIGQTETKDAQDYVYHKLPEDLFYTNRYDYEDNNIILEKSPLDYREQYIRKQLVTVYPKYKDSEYNIIKEIKFRDLNNLDYYNEIDIDSLKESIGFNKVKNFKYTIDGEKKTIKKLQFFTLTDSNTIESILKQIDYNLDDYILFEWEDTDGSIFYRLGFNIQYG